MGFSLVSKFVSTTGFVVLIWALNLLTVKGDSISLEPSTTEVNINSWAYYTCSLACDYERTHTIYWFVGDGPSYDRLVYKSINDVEEMYFESITGIHVRIEQDNSCGQDGGVVTQTLRINATSVELDGAPVQCAAIRKVSEAMDYVSYYAVLRVRDPTPTPPSAVDPSSPTTQTTMPSPTPVADCNQRSQTLDIITTITETVTATVTVTQMPAATNTPIKRARTMSDDSLTAPATKSASLKIAPASITLSLTFVLFILHFLHTHWHY